MVVPAIQRWCTAPAVIRCEALVSQLIQLAPTRVGARRLQAAALLLDGDRAGRGAGAAPRARFDNRHLLNVDLLPPADLLIQHGFERAEFLVTDSVAADLQPYLERLRDGGLEVEETDLSWGRAPKSRHG